MSFERRISDKQFNWHWHSVFCDWISGDVFWVPCLRWVWLHVVLKTQHKKISNKHPLAHWQETIVVEFQFHPLEESLSGIHCNYVLWLGSSRDASFVRTSRHMSTEPKSCFSNWFKGKTNIFQLRTTNWFRGLSQDIPTKGTFLLEHSFMLKSYRLGWGGWGGGP